MAYKQPSFAGNHPSEYNRMAGSHFSRHGLTPNKNYRQDSIGSFGQLEHLLEQQRQKYRQMKEKMEADLDIQRRNRLDCQNKLVRMKDEINRKDNVVSQLQFRQNGILHKMEDVQIENEKMRTELARMEDLYSHKIAELESELSQKTQEYEEFNEQCSIEFDNFKKQGQEYVQSLKFQHDRSKKILEDKLKIAQTGRRDQGAQIKRLNELIVQNKLLYDEQIRQLSNRMRDQQIRKSTLQSKSFEQRIKNVEQARDVLGRKNLQLMRVIQDKDRQLQELDREKNNQIQRIRMQISDLNAKNSQLNMLYEKIKGELAQKNAFITHNTGQSSQQNVYFKQQMDQKQKEIQILNSTIRDIRQNNKDITNDFQRRRAELQDRCTYYENQAKKNKDLYTKLTQTLKAKINQTITNVHYK